MHLDGFVSKFCSNHSSFLKGWPQQNAFELTVKQSMEGLPVNLIINYVLSCINKKHRKLHVFIQTLEIVAIKIKDKYCVTV
jgi:hypothetical protein